MCNFPTYTRYSEFKNVSCLQLLLLRSDTEPQIWRTSFLSFHCPFANAPAKEISAKFYFHFIIQSNYLKDPTARDLEQREKQEIHFNYQGWNK